jgi:pilus assembly protein Flp/PilA
VTKSLEASTQISPQLNMADLRIRFAHLLEDESGQDLIEYALLAALIGLTATTAVKGLGTKVASAFTTVGSTLTSNV